MTCDVTSYRPQFVSFSLAHPGPSCSSTGANKPSQNIVPTKLSQNIISQITQFKTLFTEHLSPTHCCMIQTNKPCCEQQWLNVISLRSDNLMRFLAFKQNKKNVPIFVQNAGDSAAKRQAGAAGLLLASRISGLRTQMVSNLWLSLGY